MIQPIAKPAAKIIRGICLIPSLETSSKFVLTRITVRRVDQDPVFSGTELVGCLQEVLLGRVLQRQIGNDQGGHPLARTDIHGNGGLESFSLAALGNRCSVDVELNLGLGIGTEGHVHHGSMAQGQSINVERLFAFLGTD